MVNHDVWVDALAGHVAGHPRRVIATFLVVTLVMSAGLANITTETGTSQFSEGTPAEQAFTDVNREFGPRFGGDGASTQLIQVSDNVLAKESLLRMLRIQERLAEREGLRVTSSRSAAQQVALALNPEANTLDAQIRTVEQATPSQIDTAVKQAARGPGFTGILSTDFNRRSATAGATIAVIHHNIPSGLAMGAGTSGESPLQAIQLEVRRVVESVGGDIRVFGSGIISAEFAKVIFDSLILVIPAAVVLILLFLVYAYRDPLDLLIGTVSLIMAVVWTLGFMGLVGIPFTQMLTAVPPLLLAVGIDFGIHSVNRYREERIRGRDIAASMRRMTSQLFVAFFIVTGTTVIGFSANLTSSLAPLRDFGLIAAIGIVFTFLIFGIFLPALKLEVDRWRDRFGIPAFGTAPIGREGTLVGETLQGGVWIARRAPSLFLILIILVSAGAAGYGAGIDTSFSEEDFLPPEDVPEYQKALPEPFAPATYTVTQNLNFLEDHFAAASRNSVTIYVTGRLRADYALESIAHASHDPPPSFLREGRSAQYSSIVGVIHDYADRNPSFARLVQRNDVDDDGIPDDNLQEIYDALMDSPYRAQAKNYLTVDYRAARVVYETESGSSQRAIVADAKQVADRYRLEAIATGQVVVFQAVADSIFESAVSSLTVAIALTAVFLVLIYRLLENGGTLGIVNLVPILVSVALIVSTMRYLEIPFNALTATVLSIAIGLGVDYSAHMTHRFVDEFTGENLYQALQQTVLGTGGALTGSMLTTAFGIGILVIAVTPILGQFGTVTAMAIVYSYLTSVIVLPSAIVVWERLGGYDLP
ncbi:MAG: RND family transporter [Halodesulfurarchaeum sp.]